jgi:hypothetical protein
MQEIANRSALLIVPKEPFKEWAKYFNNESIGELNDRLNEKHIYLIEFASEEDFREIIKPYYSEIFEDELMSWNYLKHEWPEERNIDVFLDWFDVTLCVEIIDLESEAIEIMDQ